LVSNVPVCVKCDSIPQKTTDLFKAEIKLNIARAKWKDAKLQLVKADEIRANLPSGHPDGTQALRNANAELSEAASEFTKALSEYSKATGKK
jgi:hypothetical protein